MLTSLSEAVGYAAQQYKLTVYDKHISEIGPLAVWARGNLTAREYAIVFKRDWLHRFNYFFPQCPEKGWGQSLNCVLLEKAVARNAAIMVVMPNEAAYEVAAVDWYNYATKYNSVRTPKSQIELGLTDKEASIPARMLRRVD